MSLLADNLSSDSKKQPQTTSSKIAIPSVVVLLENKQNNLRKNCGKNLNIDSHPSITRIH
jgi:hypothetical protein